MNVIMDVGLVHYLVLSAILFCSGMSVIIMRRNAVLVLMGLELVLNAASVNFIAFGRYGGFENALYGHVVVIFIVTLAAAEAAVALAIVLNIYNRFSTIYVDEIDHLKE